MFDKDLIKELNSLPKSSHKDDVDTMALAPHFTHAPGFGQAFVKPEFPRVEIPRQDVMNTSGAKALSEMLANKMDEQMDEFGKKHGFPVIFVFYNRKDEKAGDSCWCTSTLQMFEKDKMHEAVDFARKNEGELGVYDPKGVTK